jgi:predicted DNA-binding ribbon-helix-helix protein
MRGTDLEVAAHVVEHGGDVASCAALEPFFWHVLQQRKSGVS